jgi:hypothetical protein
MHQKVFPRNLIGYCIGRRSPFIELVLAAKLSVELTKNSETMAFPGVRLIDIVLRL